MSSRNGAQILTPPKIPQHLSIPVRTFDFDDTDDVFLPATQHLSPVRSKPITPTSTELSPLLANAGTVAGGVILQNGRASQPAVGQCPPSPTTHRSTQTVARKSSGSSLPPPRKLSTSGLLQDPSLAMYAAAAEKARESHTDSTMRKISQVGHVFTSTFGWNRHPSHDVIVAQSRTLCGRYIRYKVRALTGISCKKLNLQRLRSVTNLSAIFGPSSFADKNPSLNSVSSHLRRLGTELERSHPKVFRSVTTNVGFKTLSSEASAQNLLHSVAGELFHQEVNWGRVVALFAVAGALAMDCVRLGRPEYVLSLVDGMALIVDRRLANWIANEGGWEALHFQFRKSKRKKLLQFLLLFVMPVGLFAIVTMNGLLE